LISNNDLALFLGLIKTIEYFNTFSTFHVKDYIAILSPISLVVIMPLYTHKISKILVEFILGFNDIHRLQADKLIATIYKCPFE
jgi:hypothetical protein